MQIRDIVRENVNNKKNYIYEVCSENIFNIINNELLLLCEQNFKRDGVIKKDIEKDGKIYIRISFNSLGIDFGYSNNVSAYQDSNGKMWRGYVLMPKEHIVTNGKYVLNNHETVNIVNDSVFYEDGRSHVVATKYLYDKNILAYNIKEEICI